MTPGTEGDSLPPLRRGCISPLKLDQPSPRSLPGRSSPRCAPSGARPPQSAASSKGFPGSRDSYIQPPLPPRRSIVVLCVPEDKARADREGQRKGAQNSMEGNPCSWS
jgi:hypothetical protein